MKKKIAEIAIARAESRPGMREIINPIAAWAELGEIRALAVVAIRQDGTTVTAADFDTFLDGHALCGLIDLVKRELFEIE